MRKAWFVLFGAAAGVAVTLVATQPRGGFSGAAAKPVLYGEEYRLLGLFAGAFEQVKAHYVERPDESKMVESAIGGMLASLENSYYVDPRTASRQMACTGGATCALAFGNVGIGFAMQDGFATVESAVDESPAAKAGTILAGDIIMRIDNEAVDGLSYFQIAEKLRGDVGSQVRVEFARPGKAQAITVSLIRESIKPRSVRGRADGGDIGYIRIAAFNESTAEQLRKAIDEIGARIAPDRLKGYVVDLRNNPGGLQEAAVAAADAFLDDGEIVSIRARKFDDEKSFRAQPGDLTRGKKLVVLINAGSASMAEVVAGALKDNHRATLVGSRSFGEGSLSSLVQLGPKQGALRLTTGHYVTPAGRVIEGNGVVPDVEALQDLPDAFKTDVKLDDDKRARLQSYVPPDAVADKALAAAYDVLRR